MELYNGDCLEIMKSIPDGSIELVLTDPPYNMGKSKEWDKIPNYTEWCMKWLRECLRVLSPHGTLIFWHNNMVKMSCLINELLKEKDVIYNSTGIWYKPNFRSIAWKNKNGNTTQRSWFNVCEYFQVFTKCKTDKPGQTGWEQVKLDVNNFQNLRKYAFDMLVWIGKNANFAGGYYSPKQIEKDIRSRKAEHFFYCCPKEYL